MPCLWDKLQCKLRDKVLVNFIYEQLCFLRFVLPNHMLLQISELLPREMQGILACCNPIPALVRKNLSVLHQQIILARSQPAHKVIIKYDVLMIFIDLDMHAFNILEHCSCEH